MKKTIPKKNNVESLYENTLLTDMFSEIMEQVIKARKGHRYMESYILGWTTIEQFMLPDLINTISLRLKIDLPKNLSEIHASTLIKLYYFISHDKELYDALEQGRKTRNKLVHSIHKHKSWSEINNGFKSGIKEDIAPLYELIVKRYDETTPVPVLQLYKKGWDDCTKKIEEGFKLLEDIASEKK